MMEISTNSEGAELLHDGVSNLKSGLDSRDDDALNLPCNTTCISSGMPNTLGTATIAFIHTAKSFHLYETVISKTLMFQRPSFGS